MRSAAARGQLHRSDVGLSSNDGCSVLLALAGDMRMNHAPKRFDFSIPVRVNLYSDTQSKPTPGMKDAMLHAEVGDEQGGSDPSVWALCDRVAAMLGKEAAMFLPSGTMCNQVAIATHCSPGDE